jgi:glycosyltransferase involved in cell wall biosynthesis
MKPPDGATPSGDRLMAAQIMAALTHAGCDVRLASRLRSWLRAPDTDAMGAVEAAAATERKGLVDAWGEPADGWRPDLWLTYHLYYRAPDLIGPAVARELGIPYAAVEASHAPRREQGTWARWAEAAADAMRGAGVLAAMTTRDLQGLERLGGRKGELVRLPPFLADPGPPPQRHLRKRVADSSELPCVRLVTVAMMRPGGKHASYALLADAMARVPRGDWTLSVIGDGSERPVIENALRAACGDAVSFTGRLEPGAVRAALTQADLFIWPGHREPYGMVFLEAAAAGLPVIACRSGGVPDVTRDGESALLTAEGDAAALAGAVTRLIADEPLRLRLGAAGARFARLERGMAPAAALLRQVLGTAAATHARAA